MPYHISRGEYAAMYGPTVGDRVRLADTELFVEVEEDHTVYGEEVKFGGGKIIRDGMGQSQVTRADGAVDTVITNALIIDHWGIVKADVGISDGRIAGIGKAGNPDVQPGVDIVIGPGTEAIAGEGRILTAGGIDAHIHWICPQQVEDDIPNIILLPRAADELEIPFVSSGGQADARSLVASLAMGADGMNMGTGFMCTKEAPIHQNVKDAIVAASELDTRLIMRPLRNTERVLNNSAVERVLAVEEAKGTDITFDDILADVAGVYPKVMIDGDMEVGAWSCGMVAGLINDVPTCKELIDRIMAEAEAIIRARLEGMLAGSIE